MAIEFYKHGGEFGKSRRIKVCKISSEASESSVTSDMDPNRARTEDKPSDDTSVDTDDTDDTDDTSKISSETQSPNSSTISLATVDTVDTDDIFHKTISAHRENQEKSMTASKVMAGSNNDSNQWQ